MSEKAKREWAVVDGAHMTKVEAQTAGAIIDRMRSRGVRVTAESFFAECSKDNGGRSLFNFNREAVFKEACLDRARYILRSVTVKITREPTSERKVSYTLRRGFVAVTDKVAGRDGAGPDLVTHFVGLDEGMADAQWKKQILGRALAEANNWARRYEELKECERIVRAIDRTRAEVRA